MKRTLQDYKSGIKPVWCPGCGDYGVLSALQKVLVKLEIPPEDLINVSGIGCSGRFSHFLNGYSLHGTHGRALPTAVGAKAARPESTVIVAGGDGDGLGIGGGHIAPVARKNSDLTYILIDNRIYGLTKGQASPTTPIGTRTKTSPLGVYDATMDVLPVFLAYDVSFIARVTSNNMKEMTAVMEAALRHKGLSIVYTMSPCVTFPILKKEHLKEQYAPMPEGHDTSDKMAAIKMAYHEEPMYTGIFYQVSKPTVEDQLDNDMKIATKKNKGGKPYSIEQIFEDFS